MSWKTRVKKVFVAILIVAIIMVMGHTTYAFGSHSKCELLLRFKPGVGEHLKGKFVSAMGLEVVDEIPEIQVLVVQIPESALPKVKAALMRNPMVDFVEENEEVSPEEIPSDYYFSLQWHLIKIMAPSAWDISIGSSSVLVAILDSGVDSSHPDLTDKLLSGYNFYDNNYDASDVYGHGTKVAGVAAAATNNSIGVAGIAWRCPILPVRVTDASGYTSYSLLSKGLVYAADKGAKVAVVSFLIYSGSSLASAAKYFMDKGGLVIAAGGNTGKYEDYSDNPYILSVSATTSSDSLASFSSHGPYIDLSAPGVSIYSTVKGGSYSGVSGTSFSAPIVAGIAALMFSANPTLTPTQVEQILESTAVDLGDPSYDTYYGWGRVNASKALRMAACVSPPQPDTTPPNVAIMYPKNGETVSGGITVTVNATDDSSVSKVELYKKAVLFASDSEAPYEFYWDTTGESDGEYTLLAKAYDRAGNVGKSNVTSVNVANSATKSIDTIPPTLSITKPSDGQTISKMIDITVSAWDESGISKVEFYMNNTLVATDNVEPYVYRLNTRLFRDGWYNITAKAYDSNSNSAGASVKVYISNKK